ncbi:phage portal protein [Cytobacillus gottheilii]|uniref:Phage portal protein n=1 Tax=Cytobacillus gottheilii TaxID=859144 RepID=A0ABX8FG52_9BACI|nr:phage portal protein [Cytobacillus gottheilii]QVY62980.1 phage portal protein [Cytobacillus gottheilii]
MLNPFSKREIEKREEHTTVYTYNAFQPGEEFPPPADRERISRYKRLKKVFQNRLPEVYQRAIKLLGDTPHAPQLNTLYIAVNLADILVTKPADLLVGEPPSFESGKPDESEEQQAVNRHVEENDLVKLVHESVIGNGYRGDSWVKVRYGYRQDLSEVRNLLSPEAFAEYQAQFDAEPIIEHVNAEFVYPELSRGNVKSYKAVNICTVEYVVSKREDVPFLNVERHLPGFIKYERYRLHEFEGGIDNSYGYPLQVYKIGERVPTGRQTDVVETGVPIMLVQHAPYKSVDDEWQGISGIENIETLLTAINDRITQIDYILWKHSDPNAYGPEIEGGPEGSQRLGGVYIPIAEGDVTPGYMTWDGKLDAAFKELESLIALVFQNSETPQWLFGTVLGDNAGGTGTSHTDSGAIKARFMPILSKVKRIRTHYDKVIRDVLYICQLMDVEHGDYKYTPVYPKINWQDGIPRNEKEMAEIMQIRTVNKPTIDVQSAIKRLDNVDDEKAREISARIDNDEVAANGTVEASIFNEVSE